MPWHCCDTLLACPNNYTLRISECHANPILSEFDIVLKMHYRPYLTSKCLIHNSQWQQVSLPVRDGGSKMADCGFVVLSWWHHQPFWHRLRALLNSMLKFYRHQCPSFPTNHSSQLSHLVGKITGTNSNRRCSLGPKDLGRSLLG